MKKLMESKVWVVPEQQTPHLHSVASLTLEVENSQATTDDKNILGDSRMDSWIA